VKSRGTTYGRASAFERAMIRRAIKKIPCPYCKAPIGKGCVGMAGKSAAPHRERRIAVA